MHNGMPKLDYLFFYTPCSGGGPVKGTLEVLCKAFNSKIVQMFVVFKVVFFYIGVLNIFPCGKCLFELL